VRSPHWFRVLALSAFVLSGCASGPSIHVDKDPVVDMSSYRTFAFFDRVASDRGPYSTIMTRRIRQATQAELERLGYAYDERNPQLRVNFVLKIREKQEITGTAAPGFYGFRAGVYRAWRGYPYDVKTVDYKAGTLGIDLVDARTNSLVWQGIAEGRVSEKAARDPDAAVKAVVGEIFGNFLDQPR